VVTCLRIAHLSDGGSWSPGPPPLLTAPAPEEAVLRCNDFSDLLDLRRTKPARIPSLSTGRSGENAGTIKYRFRYQGIASGAFSWTDLMSVFDAMWGADARGLPRYPETTVGDVHASWYDASGNEHESRSLDDVHAALKTDQATHVVFHGSWGPLKLSQFTFYRQSGKGELELYSYDNDKGEAITAVVRRLFPVAVAAQPSPRPEVATTALPSNALQHLTATQSKGAVRAVPTSVIASSASWERVDIAFITILPIEYQAVLDCLDDHWPAPVTDARPNLFAWELGRISSTQHSSPYRAVVTLADQAGQISGHDATRSTIERWKPRYVVLVGVAGGLRKGDLDKLRRRRAATLGGALSNEETEATVKDSLGLGDVVVSTHIWGYEYGKLEGGFKPRNDLIFPVDKPLVRAALAFDSTDRNWPSRIRVIPPERRGFRLHRGPVASGDKVVDDASDEFFLAVWNAWPQLVAVEMEGAGAAFSVNAAREEGKVVGFVMIRGISDVPRTHNTKAPADGAQTEQRDDWKPFAAAAAAGFATEVVRHRWPVVPANPGVRSWRTPIMVVAALAMVGLIAILAHQYRSKPKLRIRELNIYTVVPNGASPGRPTIAKMGILVRVVNEDDRSHRVDGIEYKGRIVIGGAGNWGGVIESLEWGLPATLVGRYLVEPYNERRIPLEPRSSAVYSIEYGKGIPWSFPGTWHLIVDGVRLEVDRRVCRQKLITEVQWSKWTETTDGIAPPVWQEGPDGGNKTRVDSRGAAVRPDASSMSGGRSENRPPLDRERLKALVANLYRLNRGLREEARATLMRSEWIGREEVVTELLDVARRSLGERGAVETVYILNHAPRSMTKRYRHSINEICKILRVRGAKIYKACVLLEQRAAQ
jgi:nucleoside phosphorylase